MGLTAQFALREGQWWVDDDIGRIGAGDECVIGVVDEAVGFVLSQDRSWYLFSSFGLYDSQQSGADDPPAQDVDEFLSWLAGFGPVDSRCEEFVRRYMVQAGDTQWRFDDQIGDAVVGISELTRLCGWPDLDIWAELEALEDEDDECDEDEDDEYEEE